MADKPRYRVRVNYKARQDISAIVTWTWNAFGELATVRYEALIAQALIDIASDPDRIGSQSLPDILVAGARIYHLSFSRSRAPRPSVKEPRHFILYRKCSNGEIEVARILHDRRDFDRHLPDDYRTSDTTD